LVYHQGAIFGGFIAPLLSYFANEMKMGYAMLMMVFSVLVAIFVLLGPEARGKHLTADLEVFQPAE
jgi:SHS family lactate transporter-like MFS transporter